MLKNALNLQHRKSFSKTIKNFPEFFRNRYVKNEIVQFSGCLLNYFSLQGCISLNNRSETTTLK